jgi:hypothetical protein
MNAMHRHIPMLAIAAMFAACTNYDFAKARRADGSWDYPRLIADLKASGEERLRAGTWIPLIWMDLQHFGPTTEPGMPAGHKLSHLTSYGPVFCVGDRDETFVDGDGRWIEDDELDWSLWGVLHRDRAATCETTRGRRRASSGGFLLWNSQNTLYVGNPPAR